MRLRRYHPLILLLTALYAGLSSVVFASAIGDARQAYNAGDMQRALDEVNQVLQTEPNNISALFLKAQIASSNSQHNVAIENYKKLIALAPNHLEAYNNLATLYAQQGKLELASKTLEDAIKTDPVYSTIHSNLRAIYMDMSKKHYRLALKLKPEDSQTRLLAVNTRNSSDDIVSKEVPIGSAATQVAANKTLVANARNQAVLQAPAPTQPLTEGAEQEMVQAKRKPVAKTEPKPASPPTPKVAQNPPVKPKLTPKPKPASKVAAVKQTESSTPEKQVTPAVVNVVKTQPTQAGKATQQIKTALLAWANAWSNRDVNKYVDAYRAEYATHGKTYEDWVAGRRWNFKTKKYIKVALSNISIKPEGNKYRVSFRQAYESDTFQDVVNKEMLFIQQNGTWKIASERTS